MQLTCTPITLNLRTTFRIAHGATTQRHNVIAHLAGPSSWPASICQGIGEGAAVPYHGETQDGILSYLSSLAGSLGDDPMQLEQILARLPAGSAAGRAALDIALHDLWAKRLGQPLFRLLGLNPQQIPETSYTIPIDTPSEMARQANAADMPILKIKLGSPDDEVAVQAVREVTGARIRVDANAGWSRAEAAERIPRLAEYGLEFVEQPLPVGDVEGLRWLRRQNLGLPIFADENIKTAQDVIAHAGAVDGVVIKLMKSGGIRPALQAIAVARALDMQVMLGCMVESSVGVTAAAHLAPLCDYVDLDGPLLIGNDPYLGVTYEGARLFLPNLPGLGVVSRPT